MAEEITLLTPLSASKQRKSLGETSKREKEQQQQTRKITKTTIVNPRQIEWPDNIDESSLDEIKDAIKEAANQLKFPCHKVPLNEIRKTDKAQRKVFRQQWRAKHGAEIGFDVQNYIQLRSHLAIGVNCVSRLLDGSDNDGELGGVIIEKNVNPEVITKLLVPIALGKNVPIIAINGLREIFQAGCGTRCIAIGMKKSCEKISNQFHQLLNLVKTHGKQYLDNIEEHVKANMDDTEHITEAESESEYPVTDSPITSEDVSCAEASEVPKPKGFKRNQSQGSEGSYISPKDFWQEMTSEPLTTQIEILEDEEEMEHFQEDQSMNQNFSDYSDFDDDEDEETEMKPNVLFTCNICNAAFVTGLSLSRHMVFDHENEKTFPCLSCDGQFTSDEALEVHTINEHKIKNEVELASKPIKTEKEGNAVELNDDTIDEKLEDAEDHPLSNSLIAKNIFETDDDNEGFYEQPLSNPLAIDEDEESTSGLLQNVNDDDDSIELNYGYDDEGDFEGDYEDINANEILNMGEVEAELNEHANGNGNLDQFLSRSSSPQDMIDPVAKVNASLNGIRVERKFICPECGSTFMTKVNLQRHVVIHCQNRPHKCELCDKGFVRKEHLFKHMSSVHSGLKFTCEFCGKDISRKDHLIRHIRHVHPTEYLGIPPELIENKNLESMSITNLRAAGFIISDKALLSMQPKPKKPYLSCDMCPETFTQLNDLYEHQSDVHRDVRKYKCPDCPKAFKRKEHLTKHEVLHTGVKKFNCNLCGKLFPRKDALQDHIRRMHGTGSITCIEYPCNFCRKVFLQRPNLIRHLKKVHGFTVNIPEHMFPQQTTNIITNRNPLLISNSNDGFRLIKPKPATIPYLQQVPQTQKLQASSNSVSANQALLEAQQHLNKISGGKSMITISAVPMDSSNDLRPSANISKQPSSIVRRIVTPQQINPSKQQNRNIHIPNLQNIIGNRGITLSNHNNNNYNVRVQQKSFQDHVNSSSRQQYPCPNCNSVFSTQQNCRRHFLVVHRSLLMK